MIPKYRPQPDWFPLLLLAIGLGLPIQVVLSAETSVPFELRAFELRDGDRIAFLGSAFIERMQGEGYLETALTAAFPEKKLTFRNLGWSGDTVWGDSRGVFGSRADGFKRLVDDTLAAKPTVLAIAYGQNEAFAGGSGLGEFRDGLQKLLDALAPSKARVVLIAPPRARPGSSLLPAFDTYNRQLAAYRDAIKQVAIARQVSFIDWYDLSAEDLDLRGLSPMSTDGLHLTAAGEWALAPAMAKSFGAPSERILIDVDSRTGKVDVVQFRISDAKIAADAISIVGTPRSLPPPLLPLKNAESNFAKHVFRSRPFIDLRITGLEPGLYDVVVNDQKEFGAASEVLANGVSLRTSPDGGRMMKLRQLIQEKNALFFNRYRPQNETYLFLFRKHEQGNNAVEIPQYDPLIAAKEKEIAKWSRPSELRIEIR